MLKCKCGAEFEPFMRNGLILSKQCTKCLVIDGKKKRKQEWTKEKSEMKAKLKTHSEWLNDLQKVFNTYIRTRDLKKPCISCDKPLIGKFDAGHFFSVGAYPNIRFNIDNVHGQCVECNQHKHGNINEYVIRLPYRIGQERYDLLFLRRNESGKLTISEIQALLIEYKSKTRELELNRVDFYEQTESDILSNKF